MTAAVLAALASAFCFGLAATLQQQEAGLATASGVGDPRLLWRLAHRPIWVAGIFADVLAAALHVLALSVGSVALVQPLGVTGLLFAIILVAIWRRQRVQGRDIAAAVAVLAGLAGLLRLAQGEAPTGAVGHRTVIITVSAITVALAAGVAGLASVAAGRARALLLAAGAGISFGIIAVLVRAFLQLIGQPGQGQAMIWAAVGIGLLALTGYLLLQHAYRVGHFAATLATAVVLDPAAAIVGSMFVLNEPLPHTPGQGIAAALSATAVIAGIAVLVSSPAHVFTVAVPGSHPKGGEC
ncbi:MAG: DMT family transporter [Nakamurella sp.]